MKFKNISKRLWIIVIAGCALALALIFYVLPTILNNNTAQVNQIKRIDGSPLRLKIPTLNIDAPIENVGLTANGAMDVPKGPLDVAWYKLGPKPGDKGNAVVAGHYGIRKNGEPSVFDNLYKLRRGDKILVVNDKGKAISFVVRASRSYDPKADSTAVFNSSDNKSHLNLITCEGVWNKITKSYPKRLVIFADKE